MFTKCRIDHVYRHSDVMQYHSSSKIVLMSDCHRGTGSNGDNFSPNQNIYNTALNYYYKRNFHYIELGDGDELWENRSLEKIINSHCDTFAILHEFYIRNRYTMLYGNHDTAKRFKNQYKALTSEYAHCINCDAPLFQDIILHEGLILKNTDTQEEIFLIHGHQGELINDYFWRLGRFMVRYLWQPLESIGLKDPSNTYHVNTKPTKHEKEMTAWAKENNKLLVCGHTHQPILSDSNKSPLLNTGCCVFPHYITAIEIENNMATLVKWAIKSDECRILYVDREMIKGPQKIASYFNE